MPPDKAGFLKAFHWIIRNVLLTVRHILPIVPHIFRRVAGRGKGELYESRYHAPD